MIAIYTITIEFEDDEDREMSSAIDKIIKTAAKEVESVTQSKSVELNTEYLNG